MRRSIERAGGCDISDLLVDDDEADPLPMLKVGVAVPVGRWVRAVGEAFRGQVDRDVLNARAK